MPVKMNLGDEMTVELVLAAADVVGESLIWDDRRQRLVWVDIIGRRIHGLDPVTGAHQLWPITGRPTSIGLTKDGGAIVGLERHICRWDWHGQPQPVVEVEPDLPENRLNEGVVGPDGAFWVGTMFNNIADDDQPKDIPRATGRLYRYTPDGRLVAVSDDLFGITNTLVWTPDGRLVTADTIANTLYAYDISSECRLENRRAILTDYPRGFPDGSCIDSEGYIWTCRVAGGACLTRMSADGRIDRVVELPCTWPTSCCFGGANLDRLYVTSARFTMTPDYIAAHPQDGGLFVLTPGVTGLPANRFGA